MQATAATPKPAGSSIPPGVAQATAPAPGAAASISGSAGPTTAAGMRALLARRSELSSLIGNVTSRRNDIARQLRAAMPGADRSGLEQRLNQMDARIVGYEKDLDVVGHQIANARGDATTYTEQPPVPPGDLNSDQITGISVVFTFAVLMPLAIAWARAIVRRSRRDADAPAPQLMNRLDRMDEGIEAIAIEVERISEGQRFVNKLLGEGAAAPLGLPKGVGEPVSVPRADRADRADRAESAERGS